VRRARLIPAASPALQAAALTAAQSVTVRSRTERGCSPGRWPLVSAGAASAEMKPGLADSPCVTSCAHHDVGVRHRRTTGRAGSPAYASARCTRPGLLLRTGPDDA
jgi:hypothetical protein